MIRKATLCAALLYGTIAAAQLWEHDASSRNAMGSAAIFAGNAARAADVGDIPEEAESSVVTVSVDGEVGERSTAKAAGPVTAPTIEIAERFELGEIVEAEAKCPEGVDLAGVEWESALKWRKQPGEGHGIYLWPAGEGRFPLTAVFTVKSGTATLPIRYTEDVVVGKAPPAKPLSELAGPDAANLTLILKALPTVAKAVEKIVPMFDVAVSGYHAEGKLAGTDAEEPIRVELRKVQSLDQLPAKVAELVAALNAPQPPPEPDPPTPVIDGKRYVVILRETEDNTPAIGILTTQLRTGEVAAYIKTQGHKLDIFDDDYPSPLVSKLVAAGEQEPALFILDAATSNVIHSEPLPTTAAGVMAVLKAHGG